MCVITKENESDIFAQNGYELVYSAKVLFKHDPYCFYAASILAHNGIELLLKSCLIWEKRGYCKTHHLFKLANNLNFFTSNHDRANLLKKIDTFYFNRYPLTDERTVNKINETLQKIKDVAYDTDITTQAGEIENDDWDKIAQFTNELYHALPEKLQDIHKKYFERFFSHL